MEDFLVSLDVALPLFICIALGYVMRLCKLFNDDVLKVINNISFKVFLPILLFYNIYKTDITHSFNWQLIVFCIVAILVIFIIFMVAVRFCVKEPRQRAVVAQAMYRSNFVLFGMPVITTLFPDSAIGSTALAMGLCVPLFNALSVFSFEIYAGGKIKLGKIALDIVTNPLIIGAALGMIFLFAKVQLPQVLDRTVSSLAAVATPLALVALGGTFKFKSARSNLGILSVTLIFKLVLIPLVLVVIAWAIGFRGVELATVMIMGAAPTSVATYTITSAYGEDDALASEIVVFGGAICIITIFLFVFTLKSLSLI